VALHKSDKAVDEGTLVFSDSFRRDSLLRFFFHSKSIEEAETGLPLFLYTFLA